MNLQRQSSPPPNLIEIPLREVVTLPDTLSSLIHVPLDVTTHAKQSTPGSVPIERYWFGPALEKCDPENKAQRTALLGMAASWGRQVVTQVWSYYLPESQRILAPSQLDDKLHLLHQRTAEDGPLDVLLQRHAHDIYDLTIFLIRSATAEQFVQIDRQLQAELNRAAMNTPALNQNAAFDRLRQQSRSWADEAKAAWANHHLTYAEITSNIQRLRPFFASFRRVLELIVTEAKAVAGPTAEEIQAEEMRKDAEKQRQAAQESYREAAEYVRRADEYAKEKQQRADDIEREAKLNASRLIADAAQEAKSPEELRVAKRRMFEQVRDGKIAQCEKFLLPTDKTRQVLREDLAEYADVMTDEDWQAIESYEAPATNEEQTR